MPEAAPPSANPQVVDGAPFDDAAAFPADLCFAPAKLHDRSRLCWAVVGYPSGAIAKLNSGALLMRLPEQKALAISVAMTLAPLPGRSIH